MVDAGLNRRQELLWGFFDFAQGRGLEIGPLHSTTVPADLADVRYLDVFDRETLVRNYANDPGVPTELIPEIDFVLFDGTRVRSIPETLVDADLMDWVMASHVIEHVPDLIGWLAELASVVVDGGALYLAVPDRRYCFDLHRPGTSVGQMLQAHELGERVPSVRAVYDYKRGHAAVGARALWAGKPVGYEARIHSLEQVREFVEQARAGSYVDSHVWLFTPGTFLEQLVELRTLGLSQWRVESLVPTRPDELEFYAVLRRLPRSGDWPTELFEEEPRPGTMPDWVAEAAANVRELQKMAALGDEARSARARAERLSHELETTKARLDKLHARDRARWGYRLRSRIRSLPGFPVAQRVRNAWRARR